MLAAAAIYLAEVDGCLPLWWACKLQPVYDCLLLHI